MKCGVFTYSVALCFPAYSGQHYGDSGDHLYVLQFGQGYNALIERLVAISAYKGDRKPNKCRNIQNGLECAN